MVCERLLPIGSTQKQSEVDMIKGKKGCYAFAYAPLHLYDPMTLSDSVNLGKKQFANLARSWSRKATILRLQETNISWITHCSTTLQLLRSKKPTNREELVG